MRISDWSSDVCSSDLQNPFWCPDPAMAMEWEDYLDGIRKAGSSVGAVVEVHASGFPAGLGAPVYGKLDTELAAAMMSINAVKGVEIGSGFAAARLTGERSEEHTSDIQSLMRTTYAVICLKKKTTPQ